MMRRVYESYDTIEWNSTALVIISDVINEACIFLSWHNTPVHITGYYNVDIDIKKDFTSFAIHLGWWGRLLINTILS